MTHYAEHYNSYREEIKNRKKELEARLSQVDLEQQDILHFLEIEKCDAVMMSKVTKKLIVLRKERRDIKEEWAYINWIWLRIKDKIQEREQFEKVKYKTDIMKEIKGD